MNSSLRTYSQPWLRALALLLLTCFVALKAKAQLPAPEALLKDDAFEVSLLSEDDAYYLLLWSDNLEQFSEVADLAAGTNGRLTLLDPLALQSPSGFYRVERRLLSEALDVDGDGVDDATELAFPMLFDPLNPIDGLEDYDGDGVGNADEIIAGTDPEVHDSLIAKPSLTILDIFPRAGEANVSVTRRIELRLSGPVRDGPLELDAIQVFTGDEVRERIPGSLQVSPDRDTVLFYPDVMPGGRDMEIIVPGFFLQDSLFRDLDADGDGSPGGTLQSRFRTASTERVEGTNVFGFVKDSYSSEPIPNVTIRVDGLEDANAVTDANGRFELVDVPAPLFFVHIDGSTAQAPEGMVYPVVGKPFHSAAGETIPLAHHGEPFDIYLPSMSLSDRTSLSPVSETNVGFGPSGKATLAGLFPNIAPDMWDRLRLTVAPGTALDRDGNPVSEVSVIPVPADRTPSPVPAAMANPLVISIQAPGAAGFATPAPITFPNNQGLAPGARMGLYSFDHEAGRWVSVGSATVSQDGLRIVSDPGSGIRAPGWHAASQGVMGTMGQVVQGAIGSGPIVGSINCRNQTPPPPPPPPPVSWRPQGGIAILSSGQRDPAPGRATSGPIFVGSGLPPGIGNGGMISLCNQGQGNNGGSLGQSQPPQPPERRGQTAFSVRQTKFNTLSDFTDSIRSVFFCRDVEGFTFIVENNASTSNGNDVRVKFSWQGAAPEFLLGGRSFSVSILKPGDELHLPVSQIPQAPFTNPSVVSNLDQLITQDRIYEARAKLEVWLDEPAELLRSHEISVFRLVDASDGDVNDGILDFRKTPPVEPFFPDVGRFRPNDHHLGSLYVFPTNTRANIGFRPLTDEDEDQPFKYFARGSFYGPETEDEHYATYQVYERTTDGDVDIGTIQLRGRADVTRYFLNMDSLGIALAEEDIPLAAESAMLNEIDLLLPGSIQRTMNPVEADIRVNFLLDTFWRWSLPYVQGTNGVVVRKDHDLDFDRNTGIAGILASRPRYNEAQYAFVLSDAFNQRTTTQSTQSQEFLQISVFGNVDLSGLDHGHSLARQVVQGIGFQLGMILNQRAETIDDRTIPVFIVEQPGIRPLLLDCPLDPLPHPVMGPYYLGEAGNANRICYQFAWRTALGVGSLEDISRTHALYSRFAERFSLDPSLIGGQDHPQVANQDEEEHAVTRPASGILLDAESGLAINISDYGTLMNGEPSSSRSYQLRNDGGEPLTVRRFELQAGGDFTLVQSLADGTEIPAGESRPFEIRFAPNQCGTHLGRLEIETNGHLKQHVLQLRGQCQSSGGEIEVTLGTNNAGGVSLGNSRRMPNLLTIKNIGAGPLTVKSVALLSGSPHFLIDGIDMSMRLAPDEMTSVHAVFSPKAVGLHSGRIEVVTDDPDSPSQEFSLSGNGVSPSTPVDWGHDWVLIRTENASARLRSDAQGRFYAMLEPDSPYTIQVFDPDSGLVWNGSGLTAPAGETTEFGVPSFSASQSPDWDFDGLPDEINDILGAGWRFDFGTGRSPVTPGYRQVTPSMFYDPTRGFGWDPDSVVGAIDRVRSSSTDPKGDFHESLDATFSVDLPNGVYDVTLTAFDAANIREEMQFYLQGELRSELSASEVIFGGMEPPFPTPELISSRVVVRNGQLNVRMTSRHRANINALEILLVEEGVSPPNEESSSIDEGHFFYALENLDNGDVSRDEHFQLAGGSLPDQFLISSTRYRLWVLHVETLQVGMAEFSTAANPQRINVSLPRIALGESNAPDSDADRLDDIVEFILGWDPNSNDTDDDGIDDRTELLGEEGCGFFVDTEESASLGTNFVVSVMTTFNSEIYAGGYVREFGVDEAELVVARRVGGAWERLPVEFDPPLMLFNQTVTERMGVNTLTVFDDGSGPALYIGGDFEFANEIQANGLVRWSGRSFSAVSEGGFAAEFPEFERPQVHTSTVYDDGSGPALFVGGKFASADGVEARHVAKWDGTSWSGIGEINFSKGNQRHLAEVRVLGEFDGSLIVGGTFDRAGGLDAAGIGSWNGSTWSPLGTGLQWIGGPTGVSPRALHVHDGTLYVGGRFDKAGDTWAHSIARWNGRTWSAVGIDGPPSEGDLDGVIVQTIRGDTMVESLASVDDGDKVWLVAGGHFGLYSAEHGQLAHHLAFWDGVEWRGLGLLAESSPNDPTGPISTTSNFGVHALMNDPIATDTHLLIGGAFDQISDDGASEASLPHEVSNVARLHRVCTP